MRRATAKLRENLLDRSITGLFKHEPEPEAPDAENDPRYAPPTQIEMMEHARIPVFLSKMHAEHPPRWVTVRGDRLESVVGLESDEYMNDSDNHEIWSVGRFVSDFPFVKDFLNAVRPGQTGFFADQSERYAIEED